MGGAQADRILRSGVQASCASLATRLGATVPSDGKVFEQFLIHDHSATSSLLVDEFAELLQNQIRWHLDGVEFGCSDGDDAVLKQEFQAVQHVGQINLEIGTMTGSSLTITIDDGLNGQQLKSAIETQNGLSYRDQQLIFQGRVLQDDLKLYEMGVFDQAVIYLMYVPKPPGQVEIKACDNDFDYHFFCIQSVSGTYLLVDQKKDGRPMYQKGDKYLFYQEAKQRWAITDHIEWNKGTGAGAYDETAWAYCCCDALHPGEMAGIVWNVSDKTYRKYPECPLDVTASYYNDTLDGGE